MSTVKPIAIITTGGATAATLPVTGSSTLVILAVALVLLAVGGLMVRASRYRRAQA
jgi:LPXTG-motif cell wall-anchored protein